MERLPRSFFEDYTPSVAKRLLGQLLVRRIGRRFLSGILVEVEAYRGRDDPASHAFRGETPRNRVMFGEVGKAYVYFTYGFHHCLCVKTERRGVAGAILVRALEPLEGIEQMKKNRGKEEVRELASGPGKLTQALKIDRRLNGEDLVRSERLFLARGKDTAFEIRDSSRIGVDRGLEFRWRYFIGGNQFVSRGKPKT
ncbi:MAG: DNA-3-methyladenine glycosylase [Thaumarchaeota archaeon]|nr:MAG: DNA-3-methyladenine glycosylase [Nitrososphaerota archaeon]